MDDGRDPSELGGKPSDEACLGRMGVNDVRPLSPHQSIEGNQGLYVSRLERRLGDDLRDDDWPNASLQGKVEQRPFPWILGTGHQDRLESRRIQAGIQVDHMDRRASDVEPSDDPNDLYLGRMCLSAESKLLNP
jgi:hypothetical protein